MADSEDQNPIPCEPQPDVDRTGRKHVELLGAIEAASDARPVRTASSGIGAAPTLYAIRCMRECVADQPARGLIYRHEPPLPLDPNAPLRIQQAQQLERLAYLFSTSYHEFLSWREALGLTSYYGEPTLSERAADAIDAIKKELAH